MLIHISPSELLGEFKNSSEKISSMYNLGIDYAANTLDCVFEEKYVSVFDFKKYGIKMDNRWNSYEISKGSAGITIVIKTTME